MPLQKLLFSATLTQNPEKLQQLGLHQPRLFSTGLAQRGSRDADAEADGESAGKYTFPAGLTVSGAHGDRGACPSTQGPANPVLSPTAPLCALQPPLQAIGCPAPRLRDELLKGPLFYQFP